MDQRATYRIALEGLLDPGWADELGDMQILHARPAGKQPTTTLTGLVPDQAALNGLLNLVYNLGYPLISVGLLDADEVAREVHATI